MNKIKEIIARIKELREKNNLSQKEFGEIIGFSQGNIGDWERGRSQPSAKAIVSIVNKFNITADWLLLGKDTPPQDPFPLLKRLNREESKLLNVFLEFLLFKQEKTPPPDPNFSPTEQKPTTKLTKEAFFNEKGGN